jgi:adenylylsulfate kinase-like enzyme
MVVSPTDQEFWPPRAPDQHFDWNQPTHIAYHINDTHLHSPPFRASRSKLDYKYHKNPKLERQQYQDVVLSRVLDVDDDLGSEDNESSKSRSKESIEQRPFLVYTAGPMGVGKSYVLSQLHQRGIFPLEHFVKIDPDMLKSELPEMAGYLQHDAESAATKLHKESTQMSDVLFEHALAENRNVLVDGSLRDVDWYNQLFRRVRHEFPQYTLIIIYVSASADTIKARARKRAENSGRTVPEDLLQETIDQVPISVRALAPLTDHTYEITNDDNEEMELWEWSVGEGEDRKESFETEKTTWETFREVWQRDRAQSCENEQETQPLHITCKMIDDLDCSEQRQKRINDAKSIWGKAYPSHCPRCTIFADTQCGICIHGRHRCYCDECKSDGA